MKIVIIGGAGFIGINSVRYFLKQGHEVFIFDNLSRVGSDYNLHQLRSEEDVPFVEADIRDFQTIKKELARIGNIDALVLLAGQVAVTTSVINPREDFEINALGTLNVLEALRENKQSPLVIYSSTNKVYGKMDDIQVTLDGSRYKYVGYDNGISENRQLDFYSPYGCSKGTGDQYVHDYSRIYGIPSVVFRQSCIYGENQFGIEDQGWVAWFTIATILKKKFTIYGDGNQVRDVLFCQDLVELYDLAIKNRSTCAGKIYNVGGGPSSTLSLNELISTLNKKFKTELQPAYADWRPGDQKVYISDISKVMSDLKWKPRTNIETGIDKMADWIYGNRSILEKYTFAKAV
jgi:CDP-paratose 2-epimerase